MLTGTIQEQMMRLDGRTYDGLRKINIQPNFITYPEGSVLISLGNTRVICNATIEEGVPRWMVMQDIAGGWITAEYSLLPRSTHTRSPREVNGYSGRTHEIKRLIGRSLRAAVDLSKLDRLTCTVDCDVIQADGGTRTASITGGYVALAIALHRLTQNGRLAQNPIKSAVAAISVGVVDGSSLLDLCYEEDRNADVDINIVMNSEGQYIEIQGTAEGATFSRSTLDDLLNLAFKGISELLHEQSSVLVNIGVK